MYFEYRLPDSLFSIYLRVLSPLALTALRDWAPMELVWRRVTRGFVSFALQSVPLLVGGLAWDQISGP